MVFSSAVWWQQENVQNMQKWAGALLWNKPIIGKDVWVTRRLNNSMLNGWFTFAFRWSQKSSHIPGAKQDAWLLLHSEPRPGGGFQDQSRGEITLVCLLLLCLRLIIPDLPSPCLLAHWAVMSWWSLNAPSVQDWVGGQSRGCLSAGRWVGTS